MARIAEIAQKATGRSRGRRNNRLSSTKIDNERTMSPKNKGRDGMIDGHIRPFSFRATTSAWATSVHHSPP